MMLSNRRFYVWIAFFLSAQIAAMAGDGGKPQPQKQALRRIVIDPGHGGSPAVAKGFYGASGKHMEEKDVALAIGLKLRDAINAEMPDVEVIMTRTTDVFDHVVIKANKANAAKGDLFISIHCNDAPPNKHKEVTGYTTKTVKKKGKKVKVEVPIYKIVRSPSAAHGTETYIWGVGKTKDKEEALMENNFIDTAGLVLVNADNPAMKMVNSMRTYEFAQKSRRLAETVEDEFVKSGRLSRGAKQRDEKGIWVLQAVAMPAILIEVGFLSNAEEEEFITSPEGQQQTADVIVRALKRYRTSLEAQLRSGDGNK